MTIKATGIFKETEEPECIVRHTETLSTIGSRPNYDSLGLCSLLSSACADRNTHCKGCVVAVVTCKLLAGQDAPQRVSRMRVRGPSKQCSVRASIWWAMFSQG